MMARRDLRGSFREFGMKIDLLYEIQIPRPHDERSEYRAYWEAVEQIELADRMGFSTV